jgi:nuclear transport factor 2 (NTF2) superfamily protein
MSPHDAAVAWVEAWSEGWPRHDPDVIAARYAADCTFRSQPFRPADRGREAVREYARAVFEQERSARFAFAAPIVGQDGRAAVEYRAVITPVSGPVVTIAGTSSLHFDDDGFVSEHLETWTEGEGDLGIAIRPEARP